MHRISSHPNAAGNHSSPALLKLLAEKELIRRQMERAEAAVTVAEAAVIAVEAVRYHADAARSQASAAYYTYQQAKATQTRRDELRFRFLGALILLLGSLALAAIQVSVQSALVVLLVFSLPLALYAWAKARQLRGLYAPRQVAHLEREYLAWAKRDQQAQALAERKSVGYPQLVAQQQAARADLASWQREFRRCQQRLDAQQLAEQRGKQLQQPTPQPSSS